MTFFIPPVFLFGNNANRVPYDEEKKSEYKTAAETEIKVENWNIRRIAELEEENKNLNKKIELLDNENMGLNAEIRDRVEENKRLRKGIDIRLDSMGVKYIMTEEGDYFTKSDFKITE